MLRVRKPARFAFVLTLAVLLAGVFSITPAMAKPVEPERARVSVVVMQAPLASADTLTYTIKTINRGDSAAYHAVLVVPYDASALKLEDVQFSGVPAWVVKSEAGSVQIRTERLNSNGGTTLATLRFSALKPNAQLTERVSYHVADAIGDRDGRSNLPLSASMQPYAVLAHREAGNQHFFSANMFLPGEPVVFWYQLPDGTVVPTEVKNGVIIAADSTDARRQGADYAFATGDGAIDLRFSTRHLTAGEYIMVARGDISGITAVGRCTIHA